MKKFYSFAVIACVALTASAEGRQKAVTAPVKKSLEAAECITPLTTIPTITTQASGFATIGEVAGDYEWSYYGLLNGDSGEQSGIK